MRIRKNLRNLTPEESAALKRAFARAYAPSERNFEWLAGIHGLPHPVSCPHHLPDHSFLPWHREYILMLENLLRQYEPDVTLPYWDWTENPAGTPDGLPEIFQSELVDGVERNPLFSAPMRWVPEFIAANHGQLSPDDLAFLGSGRSMRQPGDPTLLNDPQGDNLRGLVEDALAAKSFLEFSNAIEQPHDSLHGFVGHHMGAVVTAAFDPIFWMHHANVDRQWAFWQLQNPNVDTHPHPEDTPQDLGATRTFGELLDIQALGYDYEDLLPLRDVGPGVMPPGISPAVRGFAAAARRPRRSRLVLEHLHMPMGESLQLRFFRDEPSADENTQTIGNPNFLGSIFLFGMGMLGGAHIHGHHEMLPFSRRLLLPEGNRPDIHAIQIVVVDTRGQRIPAENVIHHEPRLEVTRPE